MSDADKNRQGEEDVKKYIFGRRPLWMPPCVTTVWWCRSLS